jgi:spore coat polysaccharide biosynthesis protein SpsF
MGSTRLPGKVLLPLAGRPVLSWLIEGLKQAKGLDAIIAATTTEGADDPVAELARSEGVLLYRGSERDVLDRYYRAAGDHGLQAVVRVTGDNPLTEPAFIEGALSVHREAGADYTNGKNPLYTVPGSGCEVVSMAALERAWREGELPEDREHVTHYILRNQPRFRVATFKPQEPWRNPGLRLTLDEPEDYELLTRLFERLGPGRPSLAAIINLWRREPAHFDVNQHLRARPNLLASTR